MRMSRFEPAFLIPAACGILLAFAGAGHPAEAWSFVNDSNGTFSSETVDPGTSFSETFSAPSNSTNTTTNSTTTASTATSGSSAAASSDMSKTWASISAGTMAAMTINNTLVDVTYILFTASATVSNVRLTVAKLLGKPQDTLAAPPGNIYEYITVTPENITDSQITSGSITFKVSAAWISSNNIDSSTVVLYRYSGWNWNALPTSPAKGSTSDFISYVADTPGFSYFAISAQPKPQAAAQTQPNMTQTAGNFTQNITSNIITSNVTSPKGGASPLGSASKSKASLIFLALAVIAALALALLYKYKPLEKGDMPPSRFKKIADFFRGLAGKETGSPRYNFEPSGSSKFLEIRRAVEGVIAPKAVPGKPQEFKLPADEEELARYFYKKPKRTDD